MRLGGVIDSSPIIHKGGVIVGCYDKFLYKLAPPGPNAKHKGVGEVVWKYKTGGYIHSSPAIRNDYIYVGSRDHHLYALKEKVWEVEDNRDEL